MAEIRIRTDGGEYPVHIGEGVVERELVGDIASMCPRNVVVVSHPSICDLHGERLHAALAAGSDVKAYDYLFPQGEDSKNLKTLEEGYGRLLGCGITREDLVLAFGGGVVGDLAGFLAATYMRGMPYVQVPTTLMAMVDSAIGGKVGVDLPGAKNMVGAFHQPLAVYSDVCFLCTLPERELRSGLAEVAKYGFLYDGDLLATLESCEQGLPGETLDLAEMVTVCAGHKARVVETDEHDRKGVRAMLNYGHTFGHALESACGYGRLRHGEAVAVGMIMAARLSELIGLCEECLYDYHQRVLMPILGGSARDIKAGQERIIFDMQADKKRGKGLRFVLLEEPQVPRLVEVVEMRMVEAAVEETLETLRRVDPCL